VPEQNLAARKQHHGGDELLKHVTRCEHFPGKIVLIFLINLK
jgi:hypothetical protein